MNTTEDQISIVDLVRLIRRYRLMIATIVISTTTLSIVYAFLATPIYRAKVVMVPVVSEEKAGTLPAISNQLGGLAPLIDFDVGTDINKYESLATLLSRDYTTAFIVDQDLMPILFSDKWDSESGGWDVDSDREIPSLFGAYNRFDEDIRFLTEDEDTGLITLRIFWDDPELASEWANLLIQGVNQRLRKTAIESAEKSVEYLKQELEKTNIVELRQSIYRALETQINEIMIANVREEYAFRVVDPAVPPDEPVRPKKLLVVVIGLLLGLIVGILTVFVRNFIAVNFSIDASQE